MTTSTKPNFARSWSAVLTLLLAVVLLFLAFRGVDWAEMLATVQQGRLEYMLLAFCIMTLSYFLRAQRWRLLLNIGAAHPLHPLTTFWGTCIGYLGNYFLPARAGEVIRTALMAKRGNINLMYVIATALTERIIDAALLVLIVIVSLPMLEIVPDWLLSAQNGMLILSVGGIIGLLIAPRLEGVALQILARLPLPPAIKDRLQTFIEKFLLGVRAFQHPVRAVLFLGLTVVIWTLDVIVAMQVANAFDLPLTPAQLLFLLAALGLSSAIPSTPGYLGVYQFVTVSILVPMGVDQNRALVFILSFQAMTYVLVIVWGMLGLWRLNTPLAKPDLDEIPA